MDLCQSSSTLSRSGFRKVFQISLPLIGKYVSGVTWKPQSLCETWLLMYNFPSNGSGRREDPLIIWADSHSKQWNDRNSIHCGAGGFLLRGGGGPG